MPDEAIMGNESDVKNALEWLIGIGFIAVVPMMAGVLKMLSGIKGELVEVRTELVKSIVPRVESHSNRLDDHSSNFRKHSTALSVLKTDLELLKARDPHGYYKNSINTIEKRLDRLEARDKD